MTDFSIKSDDLSAGELAALRTRSLLTDPDAFGELYSTATRRSQHDWEAWLAERGNGVDRKIFVLLHERSYVGMCGVGIDRETKQSGFIWGVYLTPESRGCGGAERLLLAAHDWLMGKGIGRVDAKVAAPNNIAIKFYRRIGYETLGQDGILRDGSSIPVYNITLNLANHPVQAMRPRPMPEG